MATIKIQDKDSIDEAIARVFCGDLIILEEGEWENNLLIKKSITLKGAGRGKSVIKGKKKGWPVILIEGESEIEVIIKDLTITEAKIGKGTIWQESGILIKGKAKVTIQNSQIARNRDGIKIKDQAKVKILSSEISENETGLEIWNNSQVSISESRIYKNYFGGICTRDSSRVRILNSEIFENKHEGIDAQDHSLLTLSDSKTSKNGWDGIFLKGSLHAKITNCEISLNQGNGILIKDSPIAIIRNNIIFENEEYGISLYQSPCLNAESNFKGHIEGNKNKFWENKKGEVCPERLIFLATPQGGWLKS